MADQTDLPRGCGSQAGILLAILIATIVAAVAYWAWSGDATNAPAPSATGTPAVQPSGGGTGLP